MRQLAGTVTTTWQPKRMEIMVVGGKLKTRLNWPAAFVVVELVTPLQVAVTLAPDKGGLPMSGDGFEQVRPVTVLTVALLTVVLVVTGWQLAIDATAANTNTIIIPFPILVSNYIIKTS